ncbi:JAB domain-containing protein [Sphingomonas sp. PB2P19]|uniref:JAB domain-containing protein n=1 Tax=Sphingomonas rhamnosi TaxID=3096156 RepID=UPI002FC8585C
MPDLPPIDDLATAHALFRAIGHARQEILGLGYLDPKRRLLGLRHVAGRRGHVVCSVRNVVADTLMLGAVGVVMAHNHPSGDVRPSERDLAFTRALARGLAAVDVELLDHLVLAGDAVTSIRSVTP